MAVRFTYHGSPFASKIAQQGFRPGGLLSIAPGQVFSSPSANFASGYGSPVRMATPTSALSIPSANLSTGTIGREIIQSPKAATRGMNLASKVGKTYTGPTARRLMSGATVSGLGAPRSAGVLSRLAGGPFGIASMAGTGIGYGVDQLARAINTPEEYEAMKQSARDQSGFGYFDDVDISQPPGTDVGIMNNLANLFGSSAMADDSVVNVDNIKSAINAAKNREALNKQGLLSLDDAGLTMDPYETFAEKAKPGFNKQFAKQLGTTALGLITGNPFVGLIARGLGALAGRGGLTGIRGGADLRGDTGFDTFRRSTSFADFFQRQRDKKARESAAARGAEKQAMIDRKNFDKNFKGYFSGQNTGSGNGIGSSRGGGASPGSAGPGGSDAMGSS